MDEAAARQILTNYGAPPTPQNLMKVMEQHEGDSALLGRSMGLQGAVDESGNALDKLAFASEKPSVATAVEPNVTGAVQPTVAAPVAPVTKAFIPIRGKSGAAIDTEPQTIPTAPVQASSGTQLLPWILAALGITNVAGRNAMAPNPRGPTNGQSMEDLVPEKKTKAVPRTIGEGGAPITESGQTPQNDAIDKLATGTDRNMPESRRPINTNADERNAELSNKPVNLESKAPVTGPYEGEPLNLVEQVAKTLKKVRK